MRILLLHKYMVIGGIERTLISYTRLFKELNYHLDILLTYNIASYTENLQSDLKHSNKVHYALSVQESISILNSQQAKKKSLTQKLYYEYHRYTLRKKQKDKLLEILKKNNYDLIIDFSGVLDKVNYKSYLRIPIFRWVHSEHDVKNIINKPERYRDFRKIIAITQGMLNILRENSSLPSEVFSFIYNPLNIREIAEKSSLDIKIADKDYFIVISRLVKSKGLLELLDIYTKLKSIGIKNKLYILGDGEQKEEISHKVKLLSLENDCFLLGNKTNPYPYLKNAKLFLFTSESEGFGMVMAESMACGVPTIVMNCPIGPQEILGKNSQYGKLIPLHDQDAFVYAVQEMLENNSLYQHYQQQGHIRSQEFSEERIKERIQQLFNDILNRS